MTKLPTDPAPDALEAAYREMAADEAREREAVEWAEGLIADVADAPGPGR